jgi:hypothetical protein
MEEKIVKLILVGGQIINLAHLVHAEFGKSDVHLGLDIDGGEWAKLYMAVPEGDGEGGMFSFRPYRIYLANQDAYAMRHYLLGVAEKLNDTLLEAHNESPF